MLWTLVLFSIFVGCFTLEDGISYVVGAGKRDCFYRELNIDDVMDFDMQVLSGGDLDIDLIITSPSNKLILQKERETEVNQEVKIEEKGSYEICFSNLFSTFAEKVVYFDLGIDENNRTSLDHAELFKDIKLEKDDFENKDSIMKSLDSIGFKFEKMEHHQTVFRSKHSRHVFLQESNLRLVTWFSIGSCVVMIVVGILQVVLIRNLFENKNTKGMQNSL